jgi:hypothetical protein
MLLRIVAIPLLLGGCYAPETQVAGERGSHADLKSSEHAVAPLTMRGVDAGLAIYEPSVLARGVCVETGRTVRRDFTAEPLSLHRVTNRAELAAALNVDPQDAGNGLIDTRPTSALALVRAAQFRPGHLYALFTTSASYDSTAPIGGILVNVMANMEIGGPEFLRRCGTHVVSKVRRGAHFFVLFELPAIEPVQAELNALMAKHTQGEDLRLALQKAMGLATDIRAAIDGIRRAQNVILRVEAATSASPTLVDYSAVDQAAAFLAALPIQLAEEVLSDDDFGFGFTAVERVWTQPYVLAGDNKNRFERVLAASLARQKALGKLALSGPVTWEGANAACQADGRQLPDVQQLDATGLAIGDDCWWLNKPNQCARPYPAKQQTEHSVRRFFCVDRPQAS